MKDLYHGSIYDFSVIDVNLGKGYKDFGKGFYATAVKKHAVNLAQRNLKRILKEKAIHKKKHNEDGPISYSAFCYNLEFDDSYIENPRGLKVKVFKEADIEWIRFVLANRDSSVSTHDYDIVIGPTADENTVMIINSYQAMLVESNYSEDILKQLILELKPENLPKQYFFGSQTALKTLKFKPVMREVIL